MINMEAQSFKNEVRSLVPTIVSNNMVAMNAAKRIQVSHDSGRVDIATSALAGCFCVAYCTEDSERERTL